MSENKKSFSKWSIDDVVETFNVEIDYFGTDMDFWLNTETRMKLGVFSVF
jgi:hypothetical protein